MATAIEKSGFSPAQIQTIRRTVAADCNSQEFDLFMEACRNWGLDPFRKQIHCIVYNKDNAEKRKLAFFPSRDGLRVMASRSGDYMPASAPAEYVTDPDLVDARTNPHGILCARVTLHKQDTKTREWFPVMGEAFWDEFAPIVDEWAWNEEARRRQPTGEKALQPGNWVKMGRLMIAKCAEGQALRAGWPETFGGVHLEEEMDRMSAEIAASAALEEYETQQRIKRTGGPGIMLVFDDTGQLVKVPLGSVHDRVTEFLEDASPEEAHKFAIRNADPLKEFWAHDKAAALDIKSRIEAKQSTLGSAA